MISLKKVIEKEVGHKLHTNSRKRSYTYARAVFCKLAREMSGEKPYSLAEIGDLINRDHATVLHSLNIVFPFAMQEHSFKLLYLTLKAMFVEQEELDEESFDRIQALSERTLALEKENASLRHKLDLIKFESNRFIKMVEGLSEEEMVEIYDKLSIMTRAIKSRVYI